MKDWHYIFTRHPANRFDNDRRFQYCKPNQCKIDHNKKYEHIHTSFAFKPVIDLFSSKMLNYLQYRIFKFR